MRFQILLIWHKTEVDRYGQSELTVKHSQVLAFDSLATANQAFDIIDEKVACWATKLYGNEK